MRTCKTHRQYQHTHIIIIILPSPLWNGAFCTLGCKTQSAHEAVANITLCVGPAFHGETIPLGGGYPRTGKTWNWNIYVGMQEVVSEFVGEACLFHTHHV